MRILSRIFRPPHDPEEDHERIRMMKALETVERLTQGAQRDAERILDEVKGINGFLEAQRQNKQGSL